MTVMWCLQGSNVRSESGIMVLLNLFEKCWGGGGAGVLFF